MATEYIKHNEFVRIAIECESNINLMTEYIRTNIHPNADKKQVAQRLAHYRRKGHLPLDSGNTVSIGEVLKGTSTLKLGALTSNSYRIIPLIAGNSL